MAEESKLSPIQQIQRDLRDKVLKPVGRNNHEGVRGNLVAAHEGASEANKAARDFERRFGVVLELVGRIAAKSAASTDILRTANSAQENALGIAATVLNGTRNPHAHDALQTMGAINRDTPPLLRDMSTLREQATDLQGRLQGMGVAVETAVNQSTTNVEATFEPPLSTAPEVVRLTRKYIENL